MSGRTVAVVTGGAGGIGRAVVERFARVGTRVVIADLNAEKADETARAVQEATGTDALGVAVDVTDSASIRSARDRIVDAFGRIDHLVNCAGMSTDGPTLEHTDEEWRRVVDLNLSGTFYTTREIAPELIKTRGTVVNIASIAAYFATRPEVHVGYDATKGAIIALTRTLGVEWAPHGVRVNAVAPGYTDTELLRSVGSESPEIVATWISQTPQHRLMDPADIANVVHFLSSPESAAITAQTILADGGYSAAK